MRRSTNGSSILNKALLVILSGLAFTSHYMMKSFNQPFNTDEMPRDFFFFGTQMVVLKIVEERFSKRKKKQSED